MECKKVQDRLITEYLDRESGPDEKGEIEQHLTACADCREFFGAVQKTTVVPFQGVEEMQPNGVVWQRIQGTIEAEQSRSDGGFWKLVGVFVSRLPFPVPLVRAAFVTALILVVVVLARWPSSYADPVYGYISEQMTFIGELGSGNSGLVNGDLKDYDAAFEEIGV